jgi:hypothetical protein
LSGSLQEGRLLTDTQYVLSIDPGVSTGIALLAYNDESVWLEGSWQFSGGIAGFVRWYASNSEDNHYRTGWSLSPTESGLLELSYFDDDAPLVIAEKFTARATPGFSYRTDALEPLRVEGAMIMAGLMPDYTPKEKRWRDPGLQYAVGGKDKADKKKRQHRMLKDSGFYRTGKDLESPDADDFRSACAHGLAYLAREVKHRPTFELISKWSENNGS